MTLRRKVKRKANIADVLVRKQQQIFPDTAQRITTPWYDAKC